MGLVVQKFGGTSVADPDRMRRVARHVADTKAGGDGVVVVGPAEGLAELDAQAAQVPPAMAPVMAYLKKKMTDRIEALEDKD